MKLPVCFAIELAVRDALDQLAKQEDRSRSWLANHMLREALASRSADAQQSEQSSQ
jgi:predicted transcriptional regulator